jgi:CubicO group peptidase (beta-lactamase class C family)
MIVLLVTFVLSCQKPSQTSAGSNSTPQQFTIAKPEQVGMSTQRLARIDTVIEQYMSNNWMPGFVSLVTRKGKIVHYKSFGYKDIASKEPMEKEDIFRIMSMTKAITSVATMMLYEEGKFLLDDPVAKYIPQFKNPKYLRKGNPDDTTYISVPATKQVTVRQLLNHTAGITYAHPLYHKAGVPDFFSPDELTLSQTMPKLAAMPLMHEPGEKFTYGLNTDMLGYLVEVLSGMTLSDFFQKRIFQPLGMTDTYFYLPDNKASRLVSLYQETDTTGIINAKDNPKNPYRAVVDYPVMGARKYYSGGAGLSSTAMDYARFLQMLINGGEFNNNRILSRKTIELMTTNHIGDLTVWESKNKFGLGFEIVSPEGNTNKLSSMGAYQWGGMFFTTFWVDPKEEITAVFMTQIWPTSHGELHDKLRIAVYQAITD